MVDPTDMRNFRRQSPALPPGGGDGIYDGMEARVARVEDDIKEIKGDLKVARNDLSYIRGKVDALPTAKDFAALTENIGKLAGRVESMPSMAKLSALVAAVAVFLALLPKIQELIAKIPL